MYTEEKSVAQLFRDYRKQYYDTSFDFSDERLKSVTDTILRQGYNTQKLVAEIESLMSNPAIIKKQIKTKNNFRAENEKLSNYISLIADYLLFCQFKNQEHKDRWNNKDGTMLDNFGADNLSMYDEKGNLIKDNYFKHTDGYTILSNSGRSKIKRMEISLVDFLRVMNLIDDEDEKDDIDEALKRNNEKDKREKFEDVHKSDLVKYPELKRIQEAIDFLHKRLGHGKSEEEKEIHKQQIIDEYSAKQQYISEKYPIKVYRHINQREQVTDTPNTKQEWYEWNATPIKSRIASLEEDSPELPQLEEKLEQLRLKMTVAYEREHPYFWRYETVNRTVTTCKILDTQQFGFPEGYSAEKYYQENKKLHNAFKYEIKLVKDVLRKPIRIVNPLSSNIFDYDYSGIQFSDYHQIFELMRNYYDLMNTHQTEFNDVWIALMVYDQLIEMCDLNHEDMFVINSFKADISMSEIVKTFNERCGTDYSETKIRNLIKKNIPSKISKFYMQHRDEFIMDEFKVKGKRCSKCGIIKLPSKRNFSPDQTGKMGLLSICRDCR